MAGRNQVGRSRWHLQAVVGMSPGGVDPVVRAVVQIERHDDHGHPKSAGHDRIVEVGRRAGHLHAAGKSSRFRPGLDGRRCFAGGGRRTLASRHQDGRPIQRSGVAPFIGSLRNAVKDCYPDSTRHLMSPRWLVAKEDRGRLGAALQCAYNARTMHPLLSSRVVRGLSLSLLIAGLIAGCGAPGASDAPSTLPTHSRTATATSTLTTTITRTRTRTPTPTPTAALTATPTLTPTRTAVPTFTPVPTWTPRPTVPTWTPIPTWTPRPSRTPTITPTPTYDYPRGVVLEQANCRYGPGVAYLFEWGLYPGDRVRIHNRNEDGTWVYVDPNTYVGMCWVAARLLDIQGDIMALDAYYGPLPYSRLYRPPTNVRASRNGSDVWIAWDPVWMTEDDYRGYLVEAWVCREGRIVFVPVLAYDPARVHDTLVIIRDEPGCGEPSHGRVFAVEKHGYTDPVEIYWPGWRGTTPTATQ